MIVVVNIWQKSSQFQGYQAYIIIGKNLIYFIVFCVGESKGTIVL